MVKHLMRARFRYRLKTRQEIIFDILKVVGVIVLVVALLGFLGWAIGMAWDANEIVECNQWQSQAKIFSNFYLTHWQDEQCKAHGITVDAPVQ